MRVIILLMIACLLTGWASAADVAFTQADGYRFAETTLSLKGTPFRLWIYAPLDEAPGKACVIVPPAGSTMFFGMNLSDDDRPEHLPYVKKGHYVISFDILGQKPDKEHWTDHEVASAIRTFFEAGAGVDQVPLIITYITGHLPKVDPKAIYMAGHSSAGTLVLQASQSVDGLAGAIAYCPIVDLETRLDAKIQATIRKLVPRLKDGLALVNPMTGYLKTKCKLMLFGSTGDTNASLEEIEGYAAKLTAAKLKVSLVKGSLDHYQSMMQQGVPAALTWIGR